MKHFNQIVEAQLEAQRFHAAQAGRPALESKAQALNLYHAMMAAKQAGNLDKAREYATALRPLLCELED